MTKLKSWKSIGSEYHKCIVTSEPTHLYKTSNDVITHNSPMTVYGIGLSGSTLGKASELLLEPLTQFLEQSPVFEKVGRHDDVIAMNKSDTECKKLYYTTASRTSAMVFQNNLNIKLVQSETKLIGITFLALAAQPLDSKIKLPDGTFTNMGQLKIGDKIASPTEEETEVVDIYPKGVQDIYEIELEDGRKARCSIDHLWKVSWEKDNEGNQIWRVVSLEFIMDHPELDFDFPII